MFQLGVLKRWLRREDQVIVIIPSDGGKAWRVIYLGRRVAKCLVSGKRCTVKQQQKLYYCEDKFMFELLWYIIYNIITSSHSHTRVLTTVWVSASKQVLVSKDTNIPRSSFESLLFLIKCFINVYTNPPAIALLTFSIFGENWRFILVNWRFLFIRDNFK